MNMHKQHPQRCLHSHICKFNGNNYQDCINTDCASHRYTYNFQSEQYCLWTEDEDGVYQTSCLYSFEIINGTPETNGIKYCPYCGNLIRQKAGEQCGDNCKGECSGEVTGTPFCPQPERDAVLERLHIWFENYCEGNEDPDLWMAFLHAERTLRQAGSP